MMMDFERAVENAALRLSEHYYIVGEDLSKHDEFKRGYVMALAMVFECAPQDIERMIDREL